MLLDLVVIGINCDGKCDLNVKDSKIYTTSDGGEGIRFNAGASGSIINISGQSIIATCGGQVMSGSEIIDRAFAVNLEGTNISFTICNESIVTSGKRGWAAIAMSQGSSVCILDDVCVYGGYGEEDCICFGRNATLLNINTSGIVVGTKSVAHANGWLESAKIEKGTFGSIREKKPLENFSNFNIDYSSKEGTQQKVDFKYLTSDGELQSEKIDAYIVEIGK